MKIIKIENNISIVERYGKMYVRKQFSDYKPDWSNYEDFDFDTNTSVYSLVFTNHYENEYDKDLLNYKRKEKLKSL